MKQMLAVVAIVFAACSSTFRVFDTKALRGVHSVYVDQPWAAQALTPVLASTLPQVQLVSDPAHADAVVAVTDQISTGGQQLYSTVTYETNYNSNVGFETKGVQVPIGQRTPGPAPTTVAIAINRATGKRVVVYSGNPGYAAESLGSQFVAAWRKANS